MLIIIYLQIFSPKYSWCTYRAEIRVIRFNPYNL